MRIAEAFKNNEMNRNSVHAGGPGSGPHPGGGSGGTAPNDAHQLLKSKGWQETTSGKYTHPDHPTHRISFNDKGQWKHSSVSQVPGFKGKRAVGYQGNSTTSLNIHLGGFHEIERRKAAGIPVG